VYRISLSHSFSSRALSVSLDRFIINSVPETMAQPGQILRISSTNLRARSLRFPVYADGNRREERFRGPFMRTREEHLEHSVKDRIDLYERKLKG